MLFTNLPVEPSQSGGLLDFIRDNLYRAYEFFVSLPDLFFGTDSWWTILLSIFVIGTIINLITGEDEPLE